MYISLLPTPLHGSSIRTNHCLYYLLFCLWYSRCSIHIELNVLGSAEVWDDKCNTSLVHTHTYLWMRGKSMLLNWKAWRKKIYLNQFMHNLCRVCDISILFTTDYKSNFQYMWLIRKMERYTENYHQKNEMILLLHEKRIWNRKILFGG